jgi:HAD superfamily hydrolase (TIGR01450 family)
MTAFTATASELPERLFDAYVFDLDGTIYLGDQLLPGAARLIGALRSLDRRVVFVSNNPTRGPSMYAEKLERLGLPTHRHDIVNTVVTTSEWLRQHHPDATVFVIGEEPLQRAIDVAGIRRSTRPDEIDIVVASYDRTFDYQKLQIAFDAIWLHGRARLITTNPDAYCPFPGGRGEPDAAAIVAAIEACTGALCEANMGKPSATMLETVCRLVEVPLERCVMVGDRLYTDMKMALDAGMPAALVLTGEMTREMLDATPDEDRPDYVLDRIDLLMPSEHQGELGW